MNLFIRGAGLAIFGLPAFAVVCSADSSSDPHREIYRDASHARQPESPCPAWSRAVTGRDKRAALIACAREKFGPPPDDCASTFIGCPAYQGSVVRLSETRPVFTPPDPVYPEVAEGRTGMCNVIFDTTPYGFVRNVRADCTDPVFKANAMAAIARTAFPPAVSENKAVARHDVAYTLNFGLGPHALDAPGSYGKRACDMSVNGCEDADAPRADRDAQPIAPPRPVYPEAAVNEAKSGSCNVVVDVTAEGYPINVMAKCSDPVFVNSAKTAVEAVRFVPKVVDGQAVPRTGVVYPLEYRFE